ncbi:UNVERIFIED_CONTAM: hypothetical protein FKN15_064448 [Acipenser sinensis]
MREGTTRPGGLGTRDVGAAASAGESGAADEVRGAADGVRGTTAGYRQGEGGEEPTSTTAQTTTPAIQSGNPAGHRWIPCPLLLETLPVCLDLPVLDLEPRSLQNRSQLSTWFPAPLSLRTKMLLGCYQTSLKLPLFAASLPLGDQISLHWSPVIDLCPLLQSPVLRPSPQSTRWGSSTLVHGPYLAVPER